MKQRQDIVSRLDRPLQRERRRRFEPVRQPSIFRDVIIPVLLFWGLATASVVAFFSLLPELVLRPVQASMSVGAIAASILLIFRLRTYDSASGFVETETEMEYQPELSFPAEPPEKEVVVHVQNNEGSQRYGRTGALDGLTERQWRKLAQEILVADEQNGKITRDTLATAAVFTNLTGPGRVERYKYQDIFADFVWLGWLDDESRLTSEGRSFFGHAATSSLSSSVVVQR